ncbi:MAG: hypothetical protein IKL74_02450 [Clostridia bacterium]|nr:hypothetical protein [Clostridia bacterium]
MDFASTALFRIGSVAGCYTRLRESLAQIFFVEKPAFCVLFLLHEKTLICVFHLLSLRFNDEKAYCFLSFSEKSLLNFALAALFRIGFVAGCYTRLRESLEQIFFFEKPAFCMLFLLYEKTLVCVFHLLSLRFNDFGKASHKFSLLKICANVSRETLEVLPFITK